MKRNYSVQSYSIIASLEFHWKGLFLRTKQTVLPMILLEDEMLTVIISTSIFWFTTKKLTSGWRQWHWNVFWLNIDFFIYSIFHTVRNRTIPKWSWLRKNLFFPLFDENQWLNNENALKSNTFLLSESGLDPRSVSSWKQWVFGKFMPAYRRMYGNCESKTRCRDRMDPRSFDRSAAKLSKGLYIDLFGDWGVSDAPYHCGPGNVRRQIRRSGGRKHSGKITINLLKKPAVPFAIPEHALCYWSHLEII